MRNTLYSWWVVTASFLIGLFTAGVVFYSFTAYVNPLVAEFGWTYTQISLASSLRGLEMGIFAPVVGFLVHRFGSRVLVTTGIVLVGLGLILMSRTSSLITFYTSFLLLGLGAGGCTGVVLMSVAVSWFDKRVGLALGIISCGFGAAGLLVPLTVDLIDTHGWRHAVMMFGLSALVVGVPLALTIRDRRDTERISPSPSPDRTLSDTEPAVPAETEVSVAQAFRSPGFIFLLVAEFCRFLVVSSVIIHLIPYLFDQGLSRSRAGIIAAGIPLVSILGRLGFGWLSDYWDKRHCLTLAFVLMFFGLLAFLQPDRSFFLIAFLFAFSMGYGGGMTIRAAYIRTYFGARSFAKLIGIAMGFSSVAGILGPTMAGWTFDTRNSYLIIWIGYAVMMLAMAFLSFSAARRTAAI